jgi:2-polyprenyl-6-methoxyphenol hydroxylase-like FAD-dependent oxidoreductase
VADKDILISGASIAGPAMAYWLRRYGFNPTVVERAPAPRPGGQAVDVRGAARDVVERMGIMAEVRRACIDERGLAYVDDAGTRVATMPATLFKGEGIVAEIEILRGDLAHILYEATRHDTEYLFDDSVTGLVQDDKGVTVTFERSAPRTFGLVIGADGVHSRVRALAFGSNSDSEFIRPLGAYTAYFTAPHPLGADGWFLLYNVPGGKAAAIRPGHPHSAQAMFNFLSPPLDYDRRDTEQQKKILADTFAGVGWEVPQLLEAMWDSPDFYFAMIAQVHMGSWSRGRVALVGDAGYSPSPITGLGTSLAMVGAYVLAGEIAVAAGDHRAAFASYEAKLRGYANQCQKLPPGALRGFLPRTRTAIRLRNQSMRMATARPWRGLVAKAFQKADAITLEDYGSRLPIST